LNGSSRSVIISCQDKNLGCHAHNVRRIGPTILFLCFIHRREDPKLYAGRVEALLINHNRINDRYRRDRQTDRQTDRHQTVALLVIWTRSIISYTTVDNVSLKLSSHSCSELFRMPEAKISKTSKRVFLQRYLNVLNVRNEDGFTQTFKCSKHTNCESFEAIYISRDYGIHSNPIQ